MREINKKMNFMVDKTPSVGRNRGRVFAFDIQLIPPSIFFVIFLGISDISLSSFAFFSNLFTSTDMRV